jgi:hypothetical protein
MVANQYDGRVEWHGDQSFWTDKPEYTVDIRRTVIRLLKLGCNFDKSIFSDEDIPRADDWAAVREDPLTLSARRGNLDDLKLFARSTNNWPKRWKAEIGYFGTIIDQAAACENWHVVRWLRTEGFPPPQKRGE